MRHIINLKSGMFDIHKGGQGYYLVADISNNVARMIISKLNNDENLKIALE